MKNLFIPIEIFNRDFHSRMMIGIEALKKNFNVFIGRKSNINQLALKEKPGIYLGLVTVENHCELYKKLKLYGHRIVVLDEEGLVTFSKKMYLDLKVSNNTLKNIDSLFVCGKENKDLLIKKKNSEFNNKNIFITGNPRFDLFRNPYSKIFDPEVDIITKKYNKFILINTSFSFADHYIDNLDYKSELQKQKVLNNKEDIKKFITYLNIVKKTKILFIETIKKLSIIYPSFNIVIRPHPSENHKKYYNLCKNFKNVFLDMRFSIQPWIKSCSFLIHSYCTTPAEALCVAKKSFCLINRIDPTVHKKIPFIFNNVSFSTNEILNKIKIHFLNNKIKINNQDSMKYFIKNFGSKKLSSEIIVDIINKIKTNKYFYKNTSKENIFFSIIKNFINYFSIKNRSRKDYLEHKVPIIDIQVIKNIMNVFLDNKTDSKKYHINKIDKYTFSIKKNTIKL